MEFSDLGVIYAEGRKCSMKGFTGIAGLEKISEEEFDKIMNDFDPIEAPPGPYKLQPDKKGKTSWARSSTLNFIENDLMSELLTCWGVGV